MLFIGMICAVALNHCQPADNIDRLADEVHQISLTEPLLSGISTRLQLAQYFKKRNPSLARQYVAECVEQFGIISDSDVIAESGAKAVQLYLEIAPDEAEHAARSLPSRTQPEGLNAREAAYDILIQHFRSADAEKAEQLLRSALGTGAFRLYAGQQMFLSRMEDDVQRGHELFAQFVTAFPVARADSRDMLFLLELARPVFNTSRQLALESLDKVLQAVDRRGFEEESPRVLTARYQVGTEEYTARGRRDSVLFQVAAFLRAFEPDVYKTYSEKFRVFEEPLKSVTSPEAAATVALVGTSYAPRASDAAVARGDAFISRIRDLNRKTFPEALSTIEAILDPDLRARLLGSLLSGGRGTKGERRAAALKLIGWARDVNDDSVRADVLMNLMSRFDSAEDNEVPERAREELNVILPSLCQCKATKTSGSFAADCRQWIGNPRCPSISQKLAEYLHKHKLEPDDKTDLSVRAQYLLIRLRQMK